MANPRPIAALRRSFALAISTRREDRRERCGTLS